MSYSPRKGGLRGARLTLLSLLTDDNKQLMHAPEIAVEAGVGEALSIRCCWEEHLSLGTPPQHFIKGDVMLIVGREFLYTRH